MNKLEKTPPLQRNAGFGDVVTIEANSKIQLGQTMQNSIQFQTNSASES